MISTTVMLNWLGLTNPSTLQTTQVEYLIAAATATVGREIGRYLGAPADVELVLTGNGMGTLYLPDDPIDDVAVSTRAYPTAAWEELDETDFVVEGRALRRPIAWPLGANTKAAYARGYEPDSGPAELIELVRQLVQQAWANQSTNTAMQSETFGDYSYTRKDVTSQDGWLAVARRWRPGRV